MKGEAASGANDVGLPSGRAAAAHLRPRCVLLYGLVGAIAVAAWLVYLWCALQPGHRALGETPSGMYGLLHDAFAAGQTHLKVAPAAELLALEDPYNPTANAPYRLHDASLYQGKYYLYFSPAPVLTLFLPWTLLFGSHLGEQAAVALYLGLGYLFSIFLLCSLHRRHFPGLGGGWLIVSALVLGFGNMVLILVQWPGFYELPISAAYAFTMGALMALHRACLDPKNERAWLALAGVSFGLAMAARPNFVVAAFILFVPVLGWKAACAGGRRPGRWKHLLSLAGFAYLPLACIGGALLLYNHVRFGSPLEFGVKYQLAGQSMLEAPTLSLGAFGANVRQYLFATAKFGPYFPFFIGGEERLVGLVWGIPLLWLVLLAPVAVWRSRIGHKGTFLVMMVTAGLAVVAVLGLTCVYVFRNERYIVDFYPLFTWVAVLAMLAAVTAVHGGGWAVRLPVNAFACAAAFAMVALNLAICAARFASPQRLEAMARVLTYPASWWETAQGSRPGPIQLSVVFPRGAKGRVEPLATTGIWPTQSDILYVEYLDDETLRFGYFHVGMGGPVSAPVKITPGALHQVEFTFGGLLPPAFHPVFAGWKRRSIDVAHQTVRVTVEGTRVYDIAIDAFRSRPSDLKIGTSHTGYYFVTPAFSGEIRNRTVLPLLESDFAEPPVPPTTALKLSLVLPYERIWKNDPILATGSGTQHDLLYAVFGTRGRIKFAFNHHGAGGPVSPEFEYDPLAVHTLVLWMDNLASAPVGAGGQEAWRSRLFLTFNGAIALDAQQEFHPTTPGELVFGENLNGAGSAEPRFHGRVVEARPALKEDLPLDLGSPPPPGELEFHLRIPDKPEFSAEPLVVTGVTGAGDLLYVRYLGDGRVRFGFDHWGVGGAESEPVQLDPKAITQVRIALSPLLSPAQRARAQAEGRPNAAEVWVGGRSVFRYETAFHPTTPEQISIARNPIGGSTCGERFSGEISYLFVHP